MSKFVYLDKGKGGAVTLFLRQALMPEQIIWRTSQQYRGLGIY